MQTPEEVAREVGRSFGLWLVEQDGLDAAAALIRARDAEMAEQVRAETLAGFREGRRTMHAWKPCDCPGAPDSWREQNPHVDWSRTHEERRLVGPWEPVDQEGGVE